MSSSSVAYPSPRPPGPWSMWRARSLSRQVSSWPTMRCTESWSTQPNSPRLDRNNAAGTALPGRPACCNLRTAAVRVSANPGAGLRWRSWVFQCLNCSTRCTMTTEPGWLEQISRIRTGEFSANSMGEGSTGRSAAARTRLRPSLRKGGARRGWREPVGSSSDLAHIPGRKPVSVGAFPPAAHCSDPEGP